MIPERHRSELARLESGYWWYLGRVAWARRLIEKWANGSPVRNYADIGCGTGGFAREISRAFSVERLALIDAEPPSAVDFPVHDVSVVAADISRELRLPFTPDVVSLMDVIEHLDDDEALVSRVARLLRPGGLLVLSVPAHPWLYSEWDKHLGHRRRYRPADLVRLVERAGLKLRRLRPMWSFLLPAAPWRKFSTRKQEALEFPQVSDRMNRLLLSLSDAEYRMGGWLPRPLGTSLILSATKEPS